MPFFRVVAAKNNQKVELTAKFDTEMIARESLHKDGYSIIDIHEVAAPVESDGGFFYFEIVHQGKKKSGKIQSTDIFKAYKKLVDELGYQLISIASSPDASDEEKAYTTAKARESYDEFKRRAGPEAPVKPEEKKPVPDSENTDQE
jgi:type II secretory pathway component PulF